MQRLCDQGGCRERHGALAPAFVLVPSDALYQTVYHRLRFDLLLKRRCGLGGPGLGLCMLFSLMSERFLQGRVLSLKGNNLDFSPRLGHLLGLFGGDLAQSFDFRTPLGAPSRLPLGIVETHDDLPSVT